MLTLCLYTLGEDASVGIFEGEKNIVTASLPPGVRQSVGLVPLIHETLQKVGYNPNDLSCIAVATGPGSFTGIRVGLAAAQGFQMGLGINVKGFNAFEIIGAGIQNTAFTALTPAAKGYAYGQLFKDGKSSGDIETFPVSDLPAGNLYSYDETLLRLSNVSAPPLNQVESIARLSVMTQEDTTSFTPVPVYLRPANVTLRP